MSSIIKNQKQIVKKEGVKNKKKAQWMLNNLDKIKIRTTTDISYDPTDYIKKYLEKILKSKDGMISVTYKQGCKGNMGFGRYYAQSPSFQNILREYRHTLADGDYYDIDIKNCQPTILEQYCKKHNIVCKHLTTYVNNRSEIFKILSEQHNLSQDDIKTAFITMMFGGYPQILSRNDFINDFYNEQKVIAEKIVAIEDNKDFLNYAKKKDKKNINGTLVSYVVQDIENYILFVADEFLSKHGYSVDVLVFDGLMVRNTKEISSKFLEEMEKHIELVTGYKVEWVIKPMDDGYKFKEGDLDDVKFDQIIVVDDKQAIEEVMKHHKIKKIGGQLAILVGNQWLIDDNQVYKAITDMNIFKVNASGNPREYSTNRSGADNIFKMMEKILIADDKFIEQINKDTLNKVFYKNGYFDLVLGKFVEDLESETYIRIERDFDIETFEEYNENHKNIIDLNKHFFSVFPTEDVKKVFLESVARAIGGNYKDKLWYIQTGERNSGKGTVVDLIKNTFDNYVTTINPIVSRPSGTDLAKDNSWLLSGKCHIKRIAFSNESKTTPKEVTLDGNAIKNICSGGDTIICRTNNKDEVELINNCVVFANFNKVPEANPIDSLTTARVIPYPYTYIDNPDIDLPTQREGWNTKGYITENLEWIVKAFEWSVFKSFKDKPRLTNDLPIECKVAKEVVLGDSVMNESDLFKKHLQKITGECVPVVDVNELFKKHLKGVSQQSVKNWLKKNGFISEVKKINGASIRCYVDLKIRTQEDLEE